MEFKKKLLKKLFLEFQNSLPIKAYNREAVLPTGTNKIISVCGVRRSGKTFSMFDAINKLLKSGVHKNQILFLSFDDERLQLPQEELDLIIQAYRELYPETDIADVYIFFDEIQMTNGWESFVRRLYDTETKNIFISGSNSKMLATDIATSLRGRTIQFEIFPLSFSEYCSFRKITPNIFTSNSETKLINGFKEYLMYGGFPELVLNNYAHIEKILQEYYHIMLYKDLIERYNIKNIAVLKYFVARLLSNHTSPTSINKIYNEIKSSGLKTDKNLLYQLAEHLEAIYFTQRLGKYDNSVLKTELANERKIYFIDNGFLQALKQSVSNDYGKLLENTVFLHYRRQLLFMRGLYFYKKTKECDFVALDRDKPQEVAQVCYDMSDTNTRKREVDSLIEASTYLNCDNLKIITMDNSREINAGSKIIQVVNVIEMMMKKE